MGQLLVNGQPVRFIGFPSSVSPTPAGGNAEITNVLAEGHISSTSAYLTANFDKDISDDDWVLVHIYATIEGVDYNAYYGTKISAIGTGVNFSVNLHRSVGCRITPTSIATRDYGGSYYDMYADVEVVNRIS